MDPFESLSHIPFDEFPVFYSSFTKNLSSNYFMEQVLVYDDWEDSMRIITEETAEKPEYSRLEFFYVDEERRQL